MIPFGAINYEYYTNRNRVFGITADIRRLIPSCHNFVKKIAGEFYFKGVVFKAGNTARATGFEPVIHAPYTCEACCSGFSVTPHQKFLAGWMGFEPTTYRVTGDRSNQAELPPHNFRNFGAGQAGRRLNFTLISIF